MTGALVTIVGAAVLFAAFGLLRRGRDTGSACGHCGCRIVCERDGHRLEEWERTHAES